MNENTTGDPPDLIPPPRPWSTKEKVWAKIIVVAVLICMALVLLWGGRIWPFQGKKVQQATTNTNAVATASGPVVIPMTSDGPQTLKMPQATTFQFVFVMSNNPPTTAASASAVNVTNITEIQTNVYNTTNFYVPAQTSVMDQETFNTNFVTWLTHPDQKTRMVAKMKLWATEMVRTIDYIVETTFTNKITPECAASEQGLWWGALNIYQFGGPTSPHIVARHINSTNPVIRENAVWFCNVRDWPETMKQIESRTPAQAPAVVSATTAPSRVAMSPKGRESASSLKPLAKKPKALTATGASEVKDLRRDIATLEEKVRSTCSDLEKCYYAARTAWGEAALRQAQQDIESDRQELAKYNKQLNERKDRLAELE